MAPKFPSESNWNWGAICTFFRRMCLQSGCMSFGCCHISVSLSPLCLCLCLSPLLTPKTRGIIDLSFNELIYFISAAICWPRKVPFQDLSFQAAANTGTSHVPLPQDNHFQFLQGGYANGQAFSPPTSPATFPPSPTWTQSYKASPRHCGCSVLSLGKRQQEVW